MSENRFEYASWQQLHEDVARRGCELPFEDDPAVLFQPVRYGRMACPNRLVAQPMEGCDGEPDGRPGELTIRKYCRLGAGGWGLIWFEACAVQPQARANPRQIWLHDDSAEAFAAMLAATLEAAAAAGRPRPATVLQLTHSGRYSRPGEKPQPIIAQHSGVLDPFHKVPPDCPLIADEELDALQDAYVKAAILAAQVGFDGVDIKSCHGYLMNEILGARTRAGRYGGTYANRTRMLRETFAKVVAAAGDRLEVTTRANVCDAVDYPFGWGVDKSDCMRPDLTEPLALIGELTALGLRGVNITTGNPYYNPHVNRPADQMIANWPDPPEHPIAGLSRISSVARDVQQAHRELAVVASGGTWARQFVGNLAAGMVKQGWCSMVGLGRGSIAYPDLPSDLKTTGRLDSRKVCITCSRCSQLMRDRQCSGCVIRDAEVYLPLYRVGRAAAK